LEKQAASAIDEGPAILAHAQRRTALRRSADYSETFQQQSNVPLMIAQAAGGLLQHSSLVLSTSSKVWRTSRGSALASRLQQRCVSAAESYRGDLPDVQRLAELSQIEVTPQEVPCARQHLQMQRSSLTHTVAPACSQTAQRLRFAHLQAEEWGPKIAEIVDWWVCAGGT